VKAPVRLPGRGAAVLNRLPPLMVLNR